MNHWTDDDGARGGGRTHRMIEQLPERAAIVVPNNSTAEWLSEMITRVRGGGALYRYVVVASMAGVDRLRGVGMPIFIEHSWWDVAVKAKVVAALMEQIAITNSRFK